MLTKLGAVNRILRAGGENPVNTLNSTSGDARLAESILDEVLIECQLSGIAPNIEELTVTPDSNGEVILANNVLHVEVLDLPANFCVTRGFNPVKLYSVTNNSFVFDETSIRLRLVYGLQFEELPVSQRFYITDEAARRYQMLVAGDPAMDALLNQTYMQSRIRARAQDIRSQNASIFGRWAQRLAWWGAKRTERSSGR
jgi:hypothetical protein